MPATPWPIDDIPFKPIVGTWNESLEDNVLKTSNEVGPPKRRRRSYLPSARVSFDLVLTTTQMEALDAFYDELIDGIGSFSATDARLSVTRNFQFVQPPSVSAVGIGAWRVSIQLRRLPA